MSTLISKNIQVGADGTASNNFTIYQPASPDGTLRIGNGNTGTTSAQVVLTSAGNVGIGTSAPACQFMTNTSATGQIARFSSSTGAGEIQLNLGFTTTNQIGLFYDLGTGAGGLQTNVTTAPMVFRTSSTERMRIDSAGNVGIGTSSPTNVSNYKAITVNGTTGSFIDFQSNGTTGGRIQTDTTYPGMALFAITNQPMVFGTNGTERMRIDSSGKLEVNFGTQIVVPNGVSQDWIVGSTSASQTFCSFRDGNSTPRGSIVVNPAAGTTSFNTTSDYRLKEDVKPLLGALAKVQLLKPCTYKWKDNGAAMEGFIAHELAEVCPSAVTGEKDAVDAEGKPVYQGIDTSFLVATLTAAIQEQQAIINDLKARLDAANL
jgi:hypothetical protein